MSVPYYKKIDLILSYDTLIPKRIGPLMGNSFDANEGDANWSSVEKQSKGGMKMKKKAFSILSMVLVIAVVGGFVISNASAAAEFSADMIHKTGEETVKGKIYIKGNKIRQEMEKEGEEGVIIIRMDKGVMWSLMPEEKMYMEMPGMGDVVNDPEYEEKLEQLAEKKYLGKEKASGYVCKKYEYIYHDKSIGTLTQWFSEKLNYPIKTEMKGQSGGMDTLIEYKNIKEKRLPDSLFEIPPGYTKMSIPGMPMPK